MKSIKSKFIALIIAAVLVSGSTLVNARFGLLDECREVEGSFYVESGSQRGIYYYLGQKLDKANALRGIAANYDEDTAAALRLARTGLQNAREARDISDMYAANTTLDKAYAQSIEKLGSVALNGYDASAIESYAADFEGAQRMIERSNYNDQVRTLASTTLDRQPASFLASLVGVEAPELFG